MIRRLVEYSANQKSSYEESVPRVPPSRRDSDRAVQNTRQDVYYTVGIKYPAAGFF